MRDAIAAWRGICSDRTRRIVAALDALRANEQIDAVINLAASRSLPRAKLCRCRAETAPRYMLVEWPRRLGRVPKVFGSASAIGWYGRHATGSFAESDPADADFQAVVQRLGARGASIAQPEHTRVICAWAWCFGAVGCSNV